MRIEDPFPVLEGFVQPLEGLVLGVVVKLGVASLIGCDREHVLLRVRPMLFRS